MFYTSTWCDVHSSILPPPNGRKDEERTDITQALQGTWVNADCPNEQYVVSGQRVTRTDVNGTRCFTLQWDDQRKQLQWGTQGKLYLAWMPDGIVAWMPAARHDYKVWRWRRVMEITPCPSSSSAAPSSILLDQADSSPMVGVITPWRRPFPSSSHRGQPYFTNSDQSRHHAFSEWSGSSSEWSIDYSGHWEWFAPSYGRWDSGRWDSSPTSHRIYPSVARHYLGGPRRHRSIGPSDQRMPCGLASSEVFDLMFREITPEDYETLLRLDDTIARPTVSASSIEKLPSLRGEDALGEDCPVCLTAFESSDVLLVLPKCKHRFHSDCITKWLSECRRKCPLCGDEVPSQPES